MNATRQSDAGLETRLRDHRLAPPPPELKARVLGAARDAWAAARADDVPWTGPILRLAASLVLAAIPVLVAGIDSHRSDGGHNRAMRTVRIHAANDDVWDVTGGAQLALRLVASAATAGRDQPQRLRDRQRVLRDLLQDGGVDGG